MSPNSSEATAAGSESIPPYTAESARSCATSSISRHALYAVSSAWHAGLPVRTCEMALRCACDTYCLNARPLSASTAVAAADDATAADDEAAAADDEADGFASDEDLPSAAIPTTNAIPARSRVAHCNGDVRAGRGHASTSACGMDVPRARFPAYWCALCEAQPP